MNHSQTQSQSQSLKTKTKKRTFYEILEVPADADLDTIKRAYRRLAMKYHPDRNKEDPNAEALFKEIAQAYETLSDDGKRGRYDMKLKFGGGDDGEGDGADADDLNMDGESFVDAFDIFNTIFKQFPVSFFPMDEFFPTQQPRVVEFTFQTNIGSGGSGSNPQPFSFIHLNNSDFANIQTGFQSGINLFNNLFPQSAPPPSSKHLKKKEKESKKEKKEKKKKEKQEKKNKVDGMAAAVSAVAAEVPKVTPVAEHSNKIPASHDDSESGSSLADYDLVYNINVKLEDIYQRNVKKIQIRRKCNVVNKKEKNDAEAEAEEAEAEIDAEEAEEESKEIEIHFDEKEKVYPNEGDYGKGNLYIYIHPKEHKYYKIIHEYDLLIDYSFTIEDLLEIRANAGSDNHLVYMYPADTIKLDLNEKWGIGCDIRQITKSTNILRIKEKGLWNPIKNIRGDLYIAFELIWQLGRLSENDKDRTKLFEFSAVPRSGGDARIICECDYFNKY